MKIVTSVSEWQTVSKGLKGKRIGFVPTMGHLHAGHLHLCAQSRVQTGVTIVSIFVNPMQFNQQNDLDAYPRTIEQDKVLLEQAHVDYLFLPQASDVYPDGYDMRLAESVISAEMEGQYRPGHFDGMLTVIMKLFNILKPTHAYFGEKDYQQFMLVEKMVKDFFMPITIVGCATQRADDGLALSSRNSRLDANQRKHAKLFPAILAAAKDAKQAVADLTASGFKVDYVCDKWNRRLGAVWLGDVRLIDNIERM